MAQPGPQLSAQPAAPAYADAHTPQADTASISAVDGDGVQGQAPGYLCIQRVPPVDGHA